MAIKAPNWCEHAIPGLNGWEDPDTGEVFASTKFTDAERAEFFGKAAPAPKPAAVVEPAVIDDLAVMTKKELEELGREHGVELDRRKSKYSLIQKMRDITAPK